MVEVIALLETDLVRCLQEKNKHLKYRAMHTNPLSLHNRYTTRGRLCGIKLVCEGAFLRLRGVGHIYGR